MKRGADIRAQQKFRLKPTQTIILSFVLMIGLGTFLLMLPVSTVSGEGLPTMDALFVSTSASCVTGLTVVDAKNELSFFGKCVLLMLIQVGGLGIMTLATMAAHTMGYRFQLKQSLILQESLNQSGRAGLFDLIRRVILYTLAIEGFFALVLTCHFYPEFGWWQALGYGIFHAVSAFCNAGFDLFGNYDSLCGRPDDIFLLAGIGLPIILGGIGFTVIYDVLHCKSWRKYSLHTKIVLVSNTLLLVLGTALIFAVETGNDKTIGTMPVGQQVAHAAFMSISCRTAGFNSFDLAQSMQITQLVMIILMFIGASPLSTGGGIKSTTFFVILRSVWAVFRGESELTVFGRAISKDLRDQAFAIFTIGTIWVVSMGMILSAIDGEVHDLEEVIFETVSAFGTVGMGIGITLNWNDWGKGLLALTMLLGRVGIMTFLLAFIKQKNSTIKHPEENIMIG
ncbi:TrkH family potassium uptake protein [Selenomonas sp. AE3005]|uniref:TrkH family potassium uptake protein n=1 Tax=Selenomonas sp. AE3005 TaxID=1485543 RepID=UPI00056BF9D7|nr:potassium transporter TrkG [Selenomonas sp. AE3005]